MGAWARLFRSLVDEVEGGRPCALCVVVTSRGSTPQTAGATLLLHGEGRIEGTLGGGCVEAEVRKRALGMLARGESGLLAFDLDHDYGWDDGLLCGGRMEVAVVSLMPGADLSPFRSVIDGLQSQYAAELPVRILHQGRWIEYRLHVEATPTLLIAGAGHVGAALAKLAVDLDYRTVVIDDRADLMAAERLPPPIEPVAGDIAGTLRHWPIDANMYVVIVTRGHQHDEQALQAVINSPAKYVGMIGSRRKIGMIFDDLVELGVDRARLAQVHSPIGLKIGAVTVPEIAVSIAAELTQVRRAQTFQAITGPFDVACPR